MGNHRNIGCRNIFALFIKPCKRNKGYATNLIRFAELVAMELGHNRISLAVNPSDNMNALRLYERLGYKIISDKYLDGVYDGYEDWTVDMVKSLTSR